MKTLLLLILLSSCGKGELGGEKPQDQQCFTRAEIQALCFVEESTKLGHDPNMEEWIKDYCASIYPTEGCYPRVL